MRSVFIFIKPQALDDFRISTILACSGRIAACSAITFLLTFPHAFVVNDVASAANLSMAGFRCTGWRHNRVETGGMTMYHVVELNVFSTSRGGLFILRPTSDHKTSPAGERLSPKEKRLSANQHPESRDAGPWPRACNPF
jgi:hypothetical protein